MLPPQRDKEALITGAAPRRLDDRRFTTSAAALWPVVNVVLPVYNEENDLSRNVLRLHDFLDSRFPLTYRITIADNASSDGTWDIAESLAATLPHVTAIHLDERGRGRALKTAWSHSDASVLVYMDIDLSTDLRALLPLVAPLVSGHSDLAIGTRLARASTVERGAKREFISRCYNRITRVALRSHFSDAQCGFKAIRAECARTLLPWVEDDGWFFDTELLVIAERAGLRIHEVPVDWIDDPASSVDIVPTAVADLKGIARLRRTLSRGRLPLAALGGRRAEGRARGGHHRRLLGQVVSFGLIGAASTLAYAVLYLLLRQIMEAQAANALSLLLTAVANTAANRRITFGVRGARGQVRVQSQGLVVFAIGLAVTSGSLFLLRRYDPSAGHGVELAVLIAASVMATLLRFALFRAWIFPQRRFHVSTTSMP
jgi:putative flippase GtrA